MKNLLLYTFLLLHLPMLAQLQFNNLPEVLKYADSNDIAIQSGRIGQQIANLEKKEAKAGMLPYANVSLGYNDNIKLQPQLIPSQIFDPQAPEGSFEELTFGTRYNYSWGTQAQWDILNFQKLFAAQTATVAERNSSVALEVTRYNIYNLIAGTYYSILLTQESIQIYQENVKISDSIFRNAEEKYQKGIISEAEFSRAEINKRQNRMNLDLALNNLEQFYVELQSQLNTNQPVSIADTPEQFVLENTQIENTHPEILLQEAEVEKYKALLKQQKALRLPSLSLVYQNTRSWATDDFMNFSNGFDLQQQFFGAQISISLIGLPNRVKTRKSKVELELQELELENTILESQKADELLHLQLNQASAQLEETRKIMDLQGQVDNHAENQYEAGIMSLDQRLDIYEDLLAAQDRYLQSLASHTLAKYKIYIRQLDFQPKS